MNIPSNTKSSICFGTNTSKNDSTFETIIKQNTVLKILQKAGWPNASLSRKDELFSINGWFAKYLVILDATATKSSNTAKSNTPEKSTFSSIMKELMPPPPSPQPESSPGITIKISHLRDGKSASSYMDKWLATFSSQDIFMQCQPPLGQRSLCSNQGIYWVHECCFIQIQKERGKSFFEKAKLQDIAMQFDDFLHASSAQALRSSTAGGQVQVASETERHIRTYPQIITTYRDPHLTINLPVMTKEIFADLNTAECQYKLHKLESSIVETDRTEDVSGARSDGVFEFVAKKAGRGVIVLLVGDQEKYTVKVVRVEVDVRSESVDRDGKREQDVIETQLDKT